MNGWEGREMTNKFEVGQRVYYETDNNGPIFRGKIVRIDPMRITVLWDDGLEQPTAAENLKHE